MNKLTINNDGVSVNRSSILAGQSHGFDIGIASRYGVEEAILIHHFQHWVRINTQSKRNLKECSIDGEKIKRVFTYQSRREIALHFPYWNYDKIKYLCEKLVNEGVLIACNFNKNPIDKTLWYAFLNESEFGVDCEQIRNYYNSNNSYEGQKCPSMGKSAQPIPDSLTTDALKKKRKESTLKSAKEKSPSAPPPSDLPFAERFEGRIKISKENYERLLSKYNLPSLIEQYAQRLYEWSLENPTKFAQRKRHDITIERWIENDLKKTDQNKPFKKPCGTLSERFSIGLNPPQKANWEQNEALVEDLKKEVPERCSGLNFYYKEHILKDKNADNFSVSALIDHHAFKVVLQKHLRLKLVEDLPDFKDIL